MPSTGALGARSTSRPCSAAHSRPPCPVVFWARLEAHNILVRDSRARGDGRGTTWIWHFRHPLVQETVYASLLSATRAGLHRSAGDALEQMTDATVADRLALLALHFGRSDDRD